MTAPTPTLAPRRPVGVVRRRAFAIHYLQMLAAMGAGMIVFGGVANAVLPARGLGLEADSMLMATWMNAGMVTWMLWRRQQARPILEMCLAMYLAFAVLFPWYWAGLLPSDAVPAVGHVVMLPAMALAIVRAAR